MYEARVRLHVRNERAAEAYMDSTTNPLSESVMSFEARVNAVASERELRNLFVQHVQELMNAVDREVFSDDTFLLTLSQAMWFRHVRIQLNESQQTLCASRPATLA